MYHSHSGDVFSWEGIGGVADKETGFPHSSERERKKIAVQCRQSCSGKVGMGQSFHTAKLPCQETPGSRNTFGGAGST